MACSHRKWRHIPAPRATCRKTEFFNRLLGVVALRGQVQASDQHQDLKLHAAVHYVEAVFRMHESDSADHDNHNDQSTDPGQDFFAERTGNQENAGRDFT